MYRLSTDTSPQDTITSEEMSIGDIIYNVNYGYILKVYDGYISLSNPRHTFKMGNGNNLVGTKLRSGQSLTLTVE